jgi:hypothetical protein
MNGLGVLDGSYFCSQDCFKSYWQEHKKIHVQASMYIIECLLMKITNDFIM